MSLDFLLDKAKNENFIIPKNVLLIEYAPQIEILERASLFITHAGMNSTSEAIHYGVPVICTPVKADQPLCAIRLADNLKLGINLDTENFTSKELYDSINKVLSDESFQERIVSFARISRKYDGTKNAADIVQECLA
ncbi:unnamed protein product [Brachionus calyciflorus]|uniref:Glucuronosyltransferase n=1 Tax=Brachionus calyciflorus TaxID=104777 RepID=A0A814K6Y2_9BILA|nr:unnamed protein product [Brachionus calyciflorus]